METLREVLGFLLPKLSDKSIDIIVYSSFAALWITVTVLAAVAIYRMAKNRGIGRLWRAFIPFYNLLVLDEIVGGASIRGKRIKKIGLICMILQILYVANVVFGELTYAYNHVFKFYALKEVAGQTDVYYWVPRGAAGIGYYAASLLLQLTTIFFAFALYLEVFRSYVPRQATLFCILTIFVAPVAPIVLFCIRNRKYVNFREYMQKRMAAFYAATQQRQAPPSEPFDEFSQRPQNPYYAPQRPARPTPPSPNADGDPFEEFSEKNDASPFDDFKN